MTHTHLLNFWQLRPAGPNNSFIQHSCRCGYTETIDLMESSQAEEWLWRLIEKLYNN